EAVRLEPGFRQAYYNRGVVLRMKDRYKEAEKDHTTALKLAPNGLDPQALHERAKCRAAQEKYEEALEDLAVLVALKPENPFYLQTRGQVWGDISERGAPLQKSEADLTHAIELTPNNPNAYHSRAVTRMRAKKWQEAVEDFQKYLQLTPHAANEANV